MELNKTIKFTVKISTNPTENSWGGRGKGVGFTYYTYVFDMLYDCAHGQYEHLQIQPTAI